MSVYASDDRGELSFMQREVDGQKQQLSSDQIALTAIAPIKFARPAMRCVRGWVILRQGRWHADNTVTTCEGETLKPDLESWAINHIERRQKHSSVEVRWVWLEVPEGSQILPVANEDFCHWQPTAKTGKPEDR